MYLKIWNDNLDSFGLLLKGNGAWRGIFWIFFLSKETHVVCLYFYEICRICLFVVGLASDVTLQTLDCRHPRSKQHDTRSHPIPTNKKINSNSRVCLRKHLNSTYKAKEEANRCIQIILLSITVNTPKMY